MVSEALGYGHVSNRSNVARLSVRSSREILQLPCAELELDRVFVPLGAAHLSESLGLLDMGALKAFCIGRACALPASLCVQAHPLSLHGKHLSGVVPKL